MVSMKPADGSSARGPQGAESSSPEGEPSATGAFAPPPLEPTAAAILDAALAETVEHGIRRTTMADIARRSGVSRQTAIFGEAGPEAAVPLPDGRTIPVTLRMAGGPAAAQ